MKQIRFNPAHKHLFSEDFITGFNEGAKRQFENDIRPNGKWINSYDFQGNHYKRCSECGAYIEATFFANDYSVNFCPNCGTEMEIE